MNKENTKKLYIVGLGTHPNKVEQITASSNPIELPSNDGEFHNARHNIGLNVVRACVDSLNFPPLLIDPKTLQKDVMGGEELRDELWIASSTGNYRTPRGGEIDLNFIYPGRHLNATRESLLPFLKAQDIRPSQIVIAMDDRTLPPRQFDISLAAPRAHNGFGPITAEYSGLIPALRIGVDQPKNIEDWALASWAASEWISKLGAEFFLERVDKLLQPNSKVFHLLHLDSPENKFSQTPSRSIEYWQGATSAYANQINQVSEKLGADIISVPLLINGGYFTSEVYPVVNRLHLLYEAMLSQYKLGDPKVRGLLDGNLPEPIDPLLMDLYHHHQYLTQPDFVSMGLDDCFDFMITPNGLRMIEGDRNGGGRGAALTLSQTFLDHYSPGDGTNVFEVRADKFNRTISEAYKNHCEQLNIPQQKRPTLVMLSDHKLWEECGATKPEDFKDDQRLFDVLSKNFRVITTTEKALSIKGGKLRVKDFNNKNYPVDLLWHETTPARMDLSYYGPVVEAILKRETDVMLFGDPAKDLLFLNKAIFPVLRDVTSIQELLGDSLISRLPKELPQSTKEGIDLLSHERKLSDMIQSGVFEDKLASDLKNVLNDFYAHQRISRLLGQVGNIFPLQYQLNQGNVESLRELAGVAFIKSRPFTEFGGRGTASPSERDRAVKLMKEIAESGDYKGAAVLPIKTIAHPLIPGSRAEVRIWRSNDPVKESGVLVNGKLDPHIPFLDLVRVSPPNFEKATLRNGGGVTVTIKI